MKQCPLTKQDCTNECAWFRGSRRKYRNHVEGECSLVSMGRIPDELKEVSSSIGKLEQTIHNKEF